MGYSVDCSTLPIKTKIYVIYLLASAPLSGSGVAEVLRTTPGVEDTGDTMAETGGGFNGD
jgi:hypothetical protein